MPRPHPSSDSARPPGGSGPQDEQPSSGGAARLDDESYPAYSMGRAAELVGVTPAFLRSLGVAGLISPERSGGGHRRYSRHQLRLASRVRELVDQGIPLDAACRIVILQDQLAEARRQNTELRRSLPGDAHPGAP